ncbi:hypothetical protein [Synoicihabitans lomoniglobus]|uniref:Uncharacterized protein n=1 Tax=Synoicihabitans lomoniglobus TaxID=2909285 RepID=A0AAF0CG17_9BACT|nr:hypothetical protein [Opitutaceae bacterium LMO-M01]WED63077.1 hypothetical protein PXH66_12115 [Opitutaceae bacterium LMO-M01]
MFAVLAVSRAGAQGCVAARGCGLLEHLEHMDAMELATRSPWELSVGHRWFTSDRHFRGIHEEPERQEEGSEVINRSHFLDVGINYTVSARYSASVTLPFVSHRRSQTVRDENRVPILRYQTESAGMGDVRIEGRGWVWNPADAPRGNVLLGIGWELPTGEKAATDFFTARDAATGEFYQEERTVDQSIQPGDGGHAVVFSAFAYRRLGAGLTGFVSGLYAVTPEERSGVPTFRSSEWEAEMSIADSYSARIGCEYVLAARQGLVGSLALRVEGVPVHDVVGGSTGFRRPGYAVAIEPGLALNHGRWNARIYVPVAIQRNRQQSVPDKQRTAATGVWRVGDAAFADYSIISSVSYRF